MEQPLVQSSPEPPHLPVRSTKGCWTCRLRKKKCDEVRPGCQRCASVSIECHYGTKPKWIEDTTLGKEQLERIKILVGAAASHKRAAHRERVRQVKSHSRTLSRAEPHKDISRVGNSESNGDPSYTDTNSEIPDDVKKSKRLGGSEANLMMHYLDNVFYTQFRFFAPSISTGGRGWLLSLLNRTKPLFHAAMSLSAFHWQSLISQSQVDQAQIGYLHELERHHNLTLEELQLFIHAQNLNTAREGAFDGNVQILACMVQLISFELFNGGTGKWQVHLGAAARLILDLHSSQERKLQEGISRCDIIEKDKDRNVGAIDVGALEFFTSAIIWFDIIACISTGSSPHLVDQHKYLLCLPERLGEFDDDYGIHLDQIMGCQNWVMLIIGEIAHLSAMFNAETIDMHQLAIAAKDIQRRLDFRNSQIHRRLAQFHNEYSGAPPHYLMDIYKHYVTLVVTHVFACAAVIYLQTVVTTHPTVFHIQDPLRDAINAMSMIPDPRMVRGMIWPLCVAGCMASSTQDQEFFRSKATGAVQDARTFGNSIKAMEILQNSWEMQKRQGRLIDCGSCIQNLGICVLLV